MTFNEALKEVRNGHEVRRVDTAGTYPRRLFNDIRNFSMEDVEAEWELVTPRFNLFNNQHYIQVFDDGLGFSAVAIWGKQSGGPDKLITYIRWKDIPGLVNYLTSIRKDYP